MNVILVVKLIQSRAWDTSGAPTVYAGVPSDSTLDVGKYNRRDVRRRSLGVFGDRLVVKISVPVFNESCCCVVSVLVCRSVVRDPCRR